MKFNFLDKLKNHETLKKISICTVSIILIGFIVLSIFNVNLGMDFKGYINLEFQLGQELIEDVGFNDYKDAVIDILQQNNANVLFTDKQNSGLQTTLVVRIQLTEVTDEANYEFAQNLADEVKDNYLADFPLLQTSVSVVKGFMTNSNTFQVIYIIGFGILLTALYYMIRLKYANIVCMILSVLHNILLYFALVVITRIEINLNSFAVTILISVLSIAFVTFILSNLKNSNLEVDDINKAKEFGFNKSVMLLIVLLILPLLIFVIFGGVNAMNFGLLAILGILISYIGSSIVTLPLWVEMKKIASTRKPKLIVEETEIEDIVE